VSATGNPLVLLAAFERRYLSGTGTYSDDVLRDTDRLSAIARDRRTDPAHAGLVAARLATIWPRSAIIADRSTATRPWVMAALPLPRHGQGQGAPFYIDPPRGRPLTKGRG
jgi:hypothetical protein